jgi:hypothetical protein
MAAAMEVVAKVVVMVAAVAAQAMQQRMPQLIELGQSRLIGQRSKRGQGQISSERSEPQASSTQPAAGGRVRCCPRWPGTAGFESRRGA